MYTLKISSVSGLSGRAVEYLALSHWNFVIYVVRSTEISDTMLMRVHSKLYSVKSKLGESSFEHDSGFSFVLIFAV